MVALLFIILGAIILFFTEVVEVEITALLVLASLLLSGTLTPAEAMSGFSNEATVVVAGLLIMSTAIEKTGALQVVAVRILKFSRHIVHRIVITLMLATGGVSMLINNTPTVAVQIPIAISLAQKARISLSKLLIPISFAAILGGTCTMIGTSTNILVGSLAAGHGWQIGLFEITPMGLIYFGVGISYMLIFGRHLTPDRRAGEDLAEMYQLRRYITEIEVGPASPLVGQTLPDILVMEGIRQKNINIVELVRDDDKYLPSQAPVIQVGDLLLVQGDVDELMTLKQQPGLSIRYDYEPQEGDLRDRNIILSEGVLAPGSRLIGSTLQELRFRHRFQVVALAIRRHGRILRQRVGKVRLTFGDSLLLQGERENMEKLMESPDFLILERVRLPQPRRQKIPVAVGIFIGVVVLMAVGIIDMVTGVILGALLMLLSGCLSLKELYESVPFKVIILLGCLIPLGVAMEKTGAAAFLAGKLVRLPGLQSPYLVLLALAVVTIALTEIMTNNATAVLMVPVAFSVAAQMGISAQPLVLAVMFSASFSFLTPVGYQTNTIIYGPGGYRFSDFARVGAPLTILLLMLSVLLIPRFWPF